MKNRVKHLFGCRLLKNYKGNDSSSRNIKHVEESQITETNVE